MIQSMFGLISTRFWLLVFVVIAFVISALGKANDLKILVEPGMDSHYAITISFLGNSSGKTDLALPNEWGGMRELYKAIGPIKISPADAVISETSDPAVKSVTHKPGERITGTYQIAPGFEGQYNTEKRYRPVIDKSHIHWIGYAIWILPDWKDDDQVNVVLEWRIP